MKRLLCWLMLIASGVFTHGASASCSVQNLDVPESGASVYVAAKLGTDCEQFVTTTDNLPSADYKTAQLNKTHTGGYHGTNIVDVVRQYEAHASRAALQVWANGYLDDVDYNNSFTYNAAAARAAEVFTVSIGTAGTHIIPVEFCSEYSSSGANGNYSYAVSTAGFSAVTISGNVFAIPSWNTGSSGGVTHTFVGIEYPKYVCNSGKFTVTGSGVFKIKASVQTNARGSRIQKANGVESYQGNTVAWLSIDAHSFPCTSTSGDAIGCEKAPINNKDRPTLAQRNSPFDTDCGNAKDDGEAKGTGNVNYLFAGNPINIALGYKYQNQTDYSDGALSFVRIYRSDSTWTTNTVGALWHHNYSRSLATKTIDGVNFLDLIDGSGSLRSFSQNGSSWQPTYGDITAKLETISGGYKYTLPNDTIETYNSSGQLTRIAYSGGSAVNLVYTSGNLTSVTDEQGRSLTLSYTSGRVSSVVTPTGTFSYSYDSNGNLTQVTKPDTETRIYHYEDTNFVNALTGITDELGVRYATYAYDAQGRGISTQHAGGFDSYTLSYGDDQTTVTNPLGKQTTYHFDTILGVKKITEVEGHASTNCAAGSKFKTYNANGFLTSKTDWELNQTSYTYDAQKRVSTVTEADGSAQERTTTITYVSSSKSLVDTVTRQNLVTDYDYDAYDRVTKITMTDTTTSTDRVYDYAYFSNTTDGGGNTVLGKVQTVTDARGNSTGFTYETNGDLKTVTNARGYVWTVYARDSAGRVTEILDPNGTKDKIEYDALGRMTKYTQANNRSAIKGSTLYDYNEDGTLYKTTLANGVYLKYFYNAAGYVDKINNSDSGEYYTLDDAGNTTETKRKKISGSTIDYRFFADFDELSRVLSTHHNTDETLYEYDLNSNVTKQTDGNSRYSTFDYDALQRVTDITDRMGGQSQYSYNGLDDLTGAGFSASLDSKGNSHSVSQSTAYTYNAFGDVLSETSPDRGLSVYEYDANSNLTKRTDDEGRIAIYAYDVINRLSSITYPNETNLNVTLTYDTTSGCGAYKGRLCSVYSPSFGTISYVYDDAGRVTSVTKTPYGTSINLVTGYSYDTANYVTGITYPSGRSVAYTYNTNGEITAASMTKSGTTTPLASSIAYMAFGPAYSVTYSNGLTRTDTYDDAYRLTARSVGSSGSIMNDVYVYDSNGNIESKNSENHDYSGNDALVKQGGFEYTLDGVGNRLNLSRPSQGIDIDYFYDTGSNRLNQIDDATNGTTYLSLDGAGFTGTYGAKTYAWDEAGRLKTVSDSSGTLATYSYDAQNLRIKKVAGATTTYYVYRGSHLYGEYDSSGAMVREYVYLNGAPLAQVDTSEVVTILHTDHLGTPRVGTNSSGASVWSWASANNAFGSIAPTGSRTVNLRFAGQYADSESGLFYNHNRYYDPKTGRYISSDPIGLGGGLNTFAYTGANPVMYVDPEGKGYGAAATAGAAWDAGTPDPTDVSWPKWVLWGGAIAGGTVFDWCIINATPSSMNSDEKPTTQPPANAQGETSQAAAGAPMPDPNDDGEDAPNNNDVDHVFGDKNIDKHKLIDFLDSFNGDKVKAYNEIQKAAQALANNGRVSGLFETVVNVNGVNITVRGRVIDGVARIGTAFIP